MEWGPALVAVHLLATASMVGLIWFVQVVHYPLFDGVGADRFAEYARSHQRRTSFVVGPPMAIEGVTALWLAVEQPAGVPALSAWLGLVLLGIIHASTVFLQVPEHGALGAGHDARRVRRLVRTNWIRTIGWTARGIIATSMVTGAIRA